MTRPYHYLARSRHAGFPRRQIALSVVWERVRPSASATVAHDILCGWTAIEWSGAPGSECIGESSRGCDSDSWWRWLGSRMRSRQHIWIWQLEAAHGMTLLGFWGALSVGEWSLSSRDNAPLEGTADDEVRGPSGLCVVSDPPTIVVAYQTHRRGSVRWLDVRNLGVQSWRDMSAERGDVAALADWLQRWSRTVDQLKLGGLRHTAAAQSWHGWRHNYLECGVLAHGNEEASRLERDCVHPGRAEAYRLGLVPGPIHQLDSSSHYPACAIVGQLPVRLCWLGVCCLGDVRSAVARGWLALCECRVRSRVNLLPCRQRDRTIWPVGEWSVSLPWPEVERAADSGVSVSVVRASLYEPGRPVDAFVSTLWRHRQSCQNGGRVAEATCAKLLLNSLVGKWAAHHHAWVDAPEVLPADCWATWDRYEGEERRRVRYRSIGWHVQREERADETSESVPALAAWTYSVARMRLWEWMQTAGMSEVYYVDSDCLFVGGSGAERLCSAGHVKPGELGSLRVQGVHPSLRIGGIRDYAAGGRTVRAGVAPSGVMERNGRVEWWRNGTVMECVDDDRAPDGTARLVSVPVHRAYRHGLVDSDGRVHPIEV